MAAALKQDEETLDENSLSFHRASHHTTDEVALQSKEKQPAGESWRQRHRRSEDASPVPFHPQ